MAIELTREELAMVLKARAESASRALNGALLSFDINDVEGSLARLTTKVERAVSDDTAHKEFLNGKDPDLITVAELSTGDVAGDVVPDLTP